MNPGNLRKASIAGLLAAAIAIAVPQPGVANSRHAPSLAGTWRVQVTVYNCMTLVESPAFSSLLTFGADGSLIETTANPAFAAGQRSAGHGFWKRSGHGSWYSVLEAFVLFSSAPNGPAPGLPRGSQRIEQHIEFTGRDRISSEATIQFLDPAGSPLFAGCAKAVGTRLE